MSAVGTTYSRIIIAWLTAGMVLSTAKTAPWAGLNSTIEMIISLDGE